VNRNAASVASSSRVNASPNTVWGRSGSQPGNYRVPSPSVSYQRSSGSPSFSSRSGGNFAGVSRPSVSSSYRSMGGSGSSRGGGGSGGASSPRMSSGGGFRGGGGRR
jgi:hypothetical protein